jgi:hypothetical protein
MIKLWLRGSAIAVVIATALPAMQGAAVARGGHSHGRMHGMAMPKAATQPSSASPFVASPSAAAAPTAAASASPKVSLPVPVPTAAPAPTPASQIGAPAPQLQGLAPLSPAVTTTTLSAGGTARTDSSAASSTSPTEAAPSVAGGGGKSLQDCMDFWDRETHMTKAEWKASCVRSLNRLANLKLETLGLSPPKNSR